MVGRCGGTAVNSQELMASFPRICEDGLSSVSQSTSASDTQHAKSVHFTSFNSTSFQSEVCKSHFKLVFVSIDVADS